MPCYQKEPNGLQCKLKHFRIHSDIIQKKEDLFRELSLFFFPHLWANNLHISTEKFALSEMSIYLLR